jgi:hypothetical protein
MYKHVYSCGHDNVLTLKFISHLTLHAVVTHYKGQSFNSLYISNHYLGDHMKHMNALSGQCTEFLNVTVQGLNLYFFRKTLKMFTSFSVLSFYCD